MSRPLSARRFAALFSALVAGAAVLVAPSATAAPDLATTVRATMLQQHGEALKRQWDTQTLREPLFEPTRTSSQITLSR